MTTNLTLTLTAGTPVEIVDNSTGESAGTWTPQSSSEEGDATHAINYNTHTGPENTYGQWYYSWWAAAAGTTASTGDAVNSICPRGWVLPARNSGSRKYSSLVTSYGSSTNFTLTPLEFLKYGAYYQGHIVSTTESTAWTTTAYGYDQNKAYRFMVTQNDIPYTTSYDSKALGHQIRCVAY